MGIDKHHLIYALNSNIKEMRQCFEMHCCLITSIIEGQLETRNLQPLLDQCPKRSQEILMRDAITEAIEVLEESRKAFKSKKLEVLRKKLTQVLIDTN